MKFLVLIFISTYIFAFNVILSQKDIANGDTLLVKIYAKDGVVVDNLKTLDKDFTVFKVKDKDYKFFTFIPISYYAKSSKNEINIFYHDKKKHIKKVFFNIYNKDYEKENIKVSSSKVKPKSKDILKRISKEYKEAMSIYNKTTQNSYLKGNFIYPIDSEITSDFGKARVYNGSLKGYHGGIDFRAKRPLPIKAINDGIVILVKDRFYSGGTVLIDHGRGVYSCYFHLSKFNVKVGDNISCGDIIGLSGKSGRVTGPHLHLGIRVFGVQVNPLQFMELFNKNLI